MMYPVTNKKKFITIVSIISILILGIVGSLLFVSQYSIIHLKNKLNESTITLEYIDNYQADEDCYLNSKWDYHKLADISIDNETLNELTHYALDRRYNREISLPYVAGNGNDWNYFYQTKGVHSITINNNEGTSRIYLLNLDNKFRLDCEPKYFSSDIYGSSHIVKIDINDQKITQLYNYFNAQSYFYSTTTLTSKEIEAMGIRTQSYYQPVPDAC